MALDFVNVEIDVRCKRGATLLALENAGAGHVCPADGVAAFTVVHVLVCCDTLLNHVDCGGASAARGRRCDTREADSSLICPRRCAAYTIVTKDQSRPRPTVSRVAAAVRAAEGYLCVGYMRGIGRMV